MRVDTCLLCDAVTVREGLLNILSGGITEVRHQEYPAELGVSLALRVMVHPTEIAHSHQVEIILQDADGDRVTRVEIGTEPGEENSVPPGDEGEMLLAWTFPAQPKLPHPGRYSFELLIDGVHQASVPLTASLVGGEQ
jgi:hypothetical protein